VIFNWRYLGIGLSIGAFIGLLIGIVSPKNSYAGVAALYLVLMIILISVVLMLFARSRSVGVILLFSALAFFAASWGAMILRGV
jgi:hypothetical protein